MPLPLAVLPAIASAVDTVAGVVGKRRQEKQNKKAAERQNQRNIENWERQNKYNSPQEQMARLKEAGLNPHLVYGQGAAGAAGNAGDVKGYDREEAENVLDGQNAMRTYNDFKEITARTNNIEAQEDLAKQQAANTAAKTLNESQKLKTDQLGYKVANQIQDYQVQAAESAAKAAAADADTKTTGATTARKIQQSKIDMAAQQLKNAIATKKGISLKNAYQKIVNNMAKDNVSFKDPAAIRVVQKAMNISSKDAQRWIERNIRAPNLNRFKSWDGFWKGSK